MDSWFLVLLALTCRQVQVSPHSEPNSTAEVKGIVADVTDARIVGAILIFKNEKVAQEVKSADDGSYLI
jgi:hypothetical protein